MDSSDDIIPSHAIKTGNVSIIDDEQKFKYIDSFLLMINLNVFQFKPTYQVTEKIPDSSHLQIGKHVFEEPALLGFGMSKATVIVFYR